jgi:hypothetical protein
VLTDDIEATIAEYAAIHTYLSPEQLVSSPKILIGDAPAVADQILERGRTLGLTYQNLRGAPPEALAPVIDLVRAGVVSDSDRLRPAGLTD